MPRRKEPSFKELLIGMAIVLFGFIGWRSGLFNAAAKVFVDEAIETGREESERQQAEFKKRQEQKAAAQKTH